MNVHFMQSLLDVAKYQSITYAAQLSNISQPALSQQIKTLEKDLDTRIFERSPKGVTLTDQGKIILDYAQQFVSLHESMLDTLKASQTFTLNILATPIISAYALPCTLFHVSRTFKNYTLNVDTLASTKIEEHVRSGQAHCGLIVGLPQSNDLIGHTVITDPYYLVASPDIECPDTLSIEALYDYPLLMLANTQKSRRMLSEELQSIGVDVSSLRIPYELNSIESIKTSTVRGFGLAFLPYMVIKKELYTKQLRIISLENFSYQCDYSLIQSKRNMLGNQAIFDYIKTKLDATKC